MAQYGEDYGERTSKQTKLRKCLRSSYGYGIDQGMV